MGARLVLVETRFALAGNFLFYLAHPFCDLLAIGKKTRIAGAPGRIHITFDKFNRDFDQWV